MRPPGISLAVLVVALSLGGLSRPAAACDPATFDTPYDLADRGVTVALGTVASIKGSSIELTVAEVWKGTAGTTLTLQDPGGTCSPGFAKGQKGVVYLDADGHPLGLYNAFARDRGVIAALRRYTGGTTAAERAAPLVDLAVGRDWTRSFEAAYALADRVELLVALDAAARDRVVARLRKVGVQATLIRVAARLHDGRVPALQKRRGFEDGGALRGVIAGTFEAETDAGKLADTIGASKTTAANRIAAFERCERVHGHALARFSDYAYEPADAATWSVRADACRTGTPVP